MAASPADSASRFEHDLRRIRDARGVSLLEVQQDTRIPVDVLERFESGRLIGDPHFNEVYLRALVRAYADAVGLPSAEVLGAYEQQKADRYQGALRTHLGESQEPAAPPEPEEPREASPPEKDSEPPAGAAASTAPPAVAALQQAPRPRSEPAPVRQRPQEKARVQTRNQASASGTPIDTSWGLIIGGTLIGILLIGGVLWFLLRDDGPTPIEDPTLAQTPADTVAEAPAVPTEPQPDATGAPTLQLPITVTLIAQDGPLQGFRVTAAPDVRRPYWLEQGQEETFRSDTEVILWGEQRGEGHTFPDRARVRLQGYTWNPPTTSVIRIDQQRGQALLDSLHRAGVRPGAQPGAGAPTAPPPGTGAQPPAGQAAPQPATPTPGAGTPGPATG